MIRMRLPFMRAGARFKGTSRLQVVCAVIVGFFVGYHLLPYLFPPSPATYNSRSVGARENSLAFKHANKHAPGKDDDKWTSLQKKRVRDRGIHYDATGTKFIVEGKEKLILSGAIHYFRVIPAYWEDRLLRLKAAGLNTVETYVPWNLHEPIPGQYDFLGILDLEEYILTAWHLGLHVIIRPGPYICAEWELGGLPAWLLHYRDMKLRTPHQEYIEAVEQYFKHLFDILIPLQSAFGGPIIAFQLENEYGAFPLDSDRVGKEYMVFLYQLLRMMGVVELLFTSDSQHYMNVSVARSPAEEVLLTLNFMNDYGGLQHLKEIQPRKPRMVMEFWSGWFDHWNENHLTRNQAADELTTKVSDMISNGVSMNFYMFHGGTNFGFMNGGNWDHEYPEVYLPTVTSYDYDAPVSECGDLTEKYINIRRTISELAPNSMAVSPLPPIPGNLPKRSYDESRLTLYIPIINTLQYAPEPYYADSPVPMEYLSVNKGWGQGYGYILYRTLIPNSARHVTIYRLKDFGTVMINLKPVKHLSPFHRESVLIPPNVHEAGNGEMNLDILVENAGRVNYDVPLENRKGINGGVEVDGLQHKKWKMFALEFKSSFIESVDSGGMWLRTPSPAEPGPALFKGTFTIRGPPCDTFADMKGWGKGILFINGANLGRYWNIGPTRTLYVPGPLLKEGVNKVMIFELHKPKTAQTITFRDEPILDMKHVPP